MLKILQCDWIKTVLKSKVGQNSFTMVWKTHCQFSQMFNFRVAQPVFTQGKVCFDDYCTFIKAIIILKLRFIYPGYFCLIWKFVLMIWKISVSNMQKLKIRKGANTNTHIRTCAKYLTSEVSRRHHSQMPKPARQALFDMGEQQHNSKSLLNDWAPYLRVSPHKMNNLCIEKDSLFCLSGTDYGFVKVKINRHHFYVSL